MAGSLKQLAALSEELGRGSIDLIYDKTSEQFMVGTARLGWVALDLTPAINKLKELACQTTLSTKQ